MLHRLCGSPSIPLSFSLATVVPRRSTYRVSYATRSFTPNPTASTHRLQRGLPGYLILFDPTLSSSASVLVQSVAFAIGVLLISTHFTATPEIPTPLLYSSLPVSNAVPRLSPGLSHLT